MLFQNNPWEEPHWQGASIIKWIFIAAELNTPELHWTLFKSVPSHVLSVEFNGIVETMEQSHGIHSSGRTCAWLKHPFLLV